MTTYYKLSNQDIIKTLLELAAQCKADIYKYSRISNEYYKSWESNDEYLLWEKISDKCISLQKRWLKIKKAIDYAIINIDCDTYEQHDDSYQFIEEFINTYGCDADKQFDKYYFDDLIFDRLNEEYEQRVPKDKITFKYYRESDESDEFEFDEDEDFEDSEDSDD